MCYTHITPKQKKNKILPQLFFDPNYNEKKSTVDKRNKGMKNGQVAD